MTKIKLCGLTRECDIEWANALMPDYIGFVFARKSTRYVSPDRAKALKALLHPDIKAVGVFVNAPVEFVAQLLADNIIDVAQLHGQEDEAYIKALRARTDKPVFQAFRMDSADDVARANASSADFVLLDSGSGGTGTAFDWQLLQNIKRPYFLAGGLHIDNCASAVTTLHPYGVDVSTGIETNGKKDKSKMAEFVAMIRKEDTL